MELRVLEYFLAVAREESISGAAQYLHITQPTLSRQMKDLEEEFGKQLFVRGNRKITLTEDGMLLRKRAEEITLLAHKTEMEMLANNIDLNGDIYIGSGETKGMKLVAKTIHKMQKIHPQVKFHIYSGNAEDVAQRLDKGLLDFGIVIGPTNMSQYDFIKLPTYDIWGVYMRKDALLAYKDKIEPKDIMNEPLICSNQSLVKNELAGWIGGNKRKFNIISTYNLIYNASLLAEENCGYVLGLKGLINTDENSVLCFKELEPKLEVGLSFFWKRYQGLSKSSECFLEMIKEEFKQTKSEQ